MTDYFVYLDESGSLDFNPPRSPDESPYFAIGSVIFKGEHQDIYWDAQVLRFSLEQQGVKIPKQFHAKNDSWTTREQVFSIISDHKPRFDATFLRKENAYESIQRAGKQRLYKQAMFLHVKYLCERVIPPDADIFLVAANIGTNSLRKSAQEGLADISGQMPQNVTLCYWDSTSCWGLQSADYLLWATHRQIVRPGTMRYYESLVDPLVKSTFFPWGR